MCCTSGNVLPIDDRAVSRWQCPAQPHLCDHRLAAQYMESDLRNRCSIQACSQQATKVKLLPSMIRGMAFSDRNENSATRSANFSSSAQCAFDGRTVISDLD